MDMRRLRTIYYVVAMLLFTLAMFVVLAAVWLLTVLPDRDRRVVHRVSRFWSLMIYRLSPWWRVVVEGLENIDRTKAYVVVSNHQAMLDIPLLYTLPLDFKWVSKREVYRIPVFGWVLWMHGDVAIERGAAKAAMAMLAEGEAYLRRGVSIIMFPEGTRTKTGRVNRFKEGAVRLARQSGVDILPVVIDGTYDAFGEGGISAPHLFRVRVLPPVTAEEVGAASVRELTDGLNERMEGVHRELAPERYKD